MRYTAVACAAVFLAGTARGGMEDPFPEIRVVELPSGLQFVAVRFDEKVFRWEWDFELAAAPPSAVEMLELAVRHRAEELGLRVITHGEAGHLSLSGTDDWASEATTLARLADLLRPLADYRAWRPLCAEVAGPTGEICRANPDHFFRGLWGYGLRPESSTLFVGAPIEDESISENATPVSVAPELRAIPGAWGDPPPWLARLAPARRWRFGFAWPEPTAEDFGLVLLLRERWLPTLCAGYLACRAADDRRDGEGDVFLGATMPFSPDTLEPLRANLRAVRALGRRPFSAWNALEARERYLAALQADGYDPDRTPRAWELAKRQFAFQKRFSTNESLYFVIAHLSEARLSSAVQNWMRASRVRTEVVPRTPASWTSVWREIIP